MIPRRLLPLFVSPWREVPKSYLYEAAVLTLAEFRRAGFAAAAPGPGTRLRVELKAPANARDVSVREADALVGGQRETPAEQALKTG